MTYTSTLINKGKWRTDRADNFGEVVDYLTASPCAWGDQQWASSRRPKESKFNITDTYEQAIGLARTGWPEGRQKMVAGLDASRLINQQARIKSEELDVAGAYPMVPAFIAGVPDCMVNIGEAEIAGTQIIRIVVNISFVAGVYDSTVINRGVAILSWVDRLEAEGKRVELIALRSTEGMSSATVNRFSLMFPLKRADEPLEIDRAAFVLAHPDMLRRLMFSASESHADMKEGFESTQGRSSNYEPDDWKVPHSIYFNALRSEDENRNYNSIPKACETVEAIIQAGLTQEQAQEEETPDGA